MCRLEDKAIVLSSLMVVALLVLAALGAWTFHALLENRTESVELEGGHHEAGEEMQLEMQRLIVCYGSTHEAAANAQALTQRRSLDVE